MMTFWWLRSWPIHFLLASLVTRWFSVLCACLFLLMTCFFLVSFIKWIVTSTPSHSQIPKIMLQDSDEDFGCSCVVWVLNHLIPIYWDSGRHWIVEVKKNILRYASKGHLKVFLSHSEPSAILLFLNILEIISHNQIHLNDSC